MSRTPLFSSIAHLLGAIIIATAAAYVHVALPFLNSPPIAVADSYTVHGSAALGLLLNDSDPEGNSIVFYDVVSAPSHGTLSFHPNQHYRNYAAQYGYVGTDSFTYRIIDSFGNISNAATVTITIVNNTPTPGNDSYTVHGTQVIGPLTGNDSDPDGDSFGIEDFTQPAHGTVNWSSNPANKGYTPHMGYVGPDSFTYRIRDNLGALSSPATVSVTVVNSPPVANADYFVVSAGTATAIGPFKGNDSDPNGDTFTNPYVVTQPANGTVNPTSNPELHLYQPNSGFTGTDSFQYRITDSLGLSADATVYVLVVPSGQPPPKAPYASCPSDPGCVNNFKPESGATGNTSGGPGGSSGPSWPDPVNLATGRETFAPPSDLQVYNPTGPSVVWGAHYFSDQALKIPAGYGSPGLSRGWVHNYDVRLQSNLGTWGAVTLFYPNGSTEALTPVLSGGVPTGAFTTVAGAPYLVSGVSSTPAGAWQSVTITWKDQTKWKFTPHAGTTTYALTQITNRMGQSLNLTWNSSRGLTQVSDAGSSTVLLTLAYTAGGKLSTVTDVYNRQLSYSFTTPSATVAMMLQSVSQVVTAGTPSPPARWTYTYTSDRGQQLNTITVPSPTGTGNSTATINYSSIGKVTSLVDANGNQRVYTYNSGNTQVQVKDSANNVALSWTQKFNTSGLDTGVTDAASHSTTMAYNDTSNPLQPTHFTDRKGQNTTYTYDSFGNVLTLTTRRGLTTTYTWSYSNFALGRLTSIQEGTKPATTFTYYEPSGLVNTITRPEPNNGAGTITTTYTYDSLGNVLTVVSPGNDATSTITTTLNYTTDGGYSQSAKIGQPLTIIDNLSHVTHLRYDSQGRATSVTDADGNETDFTYNLVGQVITTTRPATGQTGSGNSKSTNAYLYVGGPITSKTFYDESNTQVRQVAMTYGLEGERLTVSGTEAVTNTYDALYRPKTVKDGNNNITTYTYNSIGRPATITLPGGEVTQFTSYDNAGNLLQRIDGNNVTTNYVYNDPESFLTDIQYPASTSLNVHFDYDAYGRRESMTDANGTQDYSYGNLSELLSVTTTYTGLSAKTISYSYYPNGSRESMTTPAGVFDYSFDAAGRPASMTNPFGETTTWTHRNNNWLQDQTLDNGGSATYTYNSLGQVTRLLNEVGATTISDFSSITYNGIGNKSSVTASVPGATSLDGTTTYTYDSLDQLSQESSTRDGGFTNNFGYDSAGNPTSFKGVTQSYNSNNQQTDTGFAYDDNGNPTTYKGTSLSFDPENRLTAFGTVLTAGYNGDGLRCWKQNASGTTYFLYDGSWPIIELDASGSVIATNTFGPTGLTSRREGTDSIFYSFDSEGNVSQRTDSNGTVLVNSLFDAHGSTVSGAPTDPFGYKAQWGYYSDAETGLQILTHRYYDPDSGRFLTADPIGPNGGINLYSYVLNNPVNSVDPNGTYPDQITPFNAEQRKMFEEAYEVAQKALAESCECRKAVAGTSNDFIVGLRDPSGNLRRLHKSFFYGGQASTGTTEVYGRASIMSVILYQAFFSHYALMDLAEQNYRYNGVVAWMVDITDAQLRASIILHELRHMINHGPEAVHNARYISKIWNWEIFSSCFPKKK